MNARGDRPLLEEQRATVFLLDGSYTVFRSFYAVAPLTAPDGTPTNGVFGFVNLVRKLIDEQRPDHFAIAFDLAGPTFRDALFEDYKAQRSEPPKELIPQFGLALRAAELMGWPVLTAEDFEADDVLASLAAEAVEKGFRVVIVTADKDLYQLVSERVHVLNPSKGDRLLDPAGVREIFGVPPERVVDVLSLMGDKVDNVPGVPGIGEKGAKALVLRYGGLSEILSRARLFQKLWEAHERALGALEAGDVEALAEALREVAAPAETLARLERDLGGELGENLGRRFANLAELPACSGELSSRALRKALKEIEKKTQPKSWLSLARHEREARFSQELVVLRKDAPVALDLDAMVPGQPRAEEAAAFFRQLGFRRLSAQMEEHAHKVSARIGDRLAVRVIDDAAGLSTLVEEVRSAKVLSVDTETDSLDPRHARLVGISLAYDEEGGAYISCLTPGGPRILWEEAWAELASLLADSSIPKIGQNLKFDRAVLRTAGLDLEGIAFDTLIAAQLLEPGRIVSHKLDDLAWRILGERMISFEEIAGKGKEQRSLDELPVEVVARYAVEDAVVALRLVGPLRERLKKQGLWKLFEHIEQPLVRVLEKMEARGIRLESNRLQAMSTELGEEIQRVEAQVHTLAGHPFNINSPQQLRIVLFEELGLSPTGRRTQKTRAHSTGQEAMEALAAVHPLPAKVLDYRELTKLKSTYVDALPRLVDPDDGRVHTHFHQLGAATGRLSSSDPNLQNIPTRSSLGRKIREAFVPKKGWRLVSADYSQMELRVLAHLAGDERLIEAFRKGFDVHRYTAALVHGISIEEVSGEERSRAKAVNFGIVYGMSEYRLAREQNLSRDEARAFIEAYFARYPRVREYIDAVNSSVCETGEVRTIFSRVRYFPELISAEGVSRVNRMQRETLLRQAVNSTVQGSAADIVKRAMVALDQGLEEGGFRAQLLLQVHDELVLEAPEEELGRLETLLREVMEGAADLAVPLTVELRFAENWAAAH